MKLDHYLMPFTKINSKRIKDLKLRPETIKLPEANICSTLFGFSLKRIFSNTMSTQTRETKERINKWDFIRLKSFWKAKETKIKMKKQPLNWEKIFASNIYDKWLISIIYKELTQLNYKKINKWDFIRLKSFWKAKETKIKMKKQPTNWEKILANCISDKGLISIIYKELTQMN